MNLATTSIEPQLEPELQIAALASISLVDLNIAAALQTRIDRKYIIDRHQLSTLLCSLDDRVAALEIDGQRNFGYESVYFDTPDLISFYSAAHKRRQRFKVRTRSYIDSRTTMLEVKTKGNRGGTVKRRHSHDFDSRRELDIGALAFVDSVLCNHDLVALLRPVMTTRYDRMTLVDLDETTRLTIDSGLRCTSSSGAITGLDSSFIVETKSGGAPSVADRQLWALGIRPSRISKFGTAMAALDPSLPSNKWNRTLNRHFR